MFHYSRKARARSSSCTLFDDHSPLRILSKTVSGPAPSLSDDLYSAAATFALLTSSDIVSLSVELNSLVPTLLPWIIFLARDELTVKEGENAAAYPRSRGDVASNRGMNFPLHNNSKEEIVNDKGGDEKCEYDGTTDEAAYHLIGNIQTYKTLLAL